MSDEISACIHLLQAYSQLAGGSWVFVYHESPMSPESRSLCEFSGERLEALALVEQVTRYLEESAREAGGKEALETLAGDDLRN